VPLIAAELFGVKLIGVNAANGRKLLFTIVFLAILWTVTHLVRWTIRKLVPRDTRTAFWSRQFISIAALLITVLALASIWFDNPARAAAALALISAGLAFALQRVVTSLAGYLLILRGAMFNVGDRIKMGGVRGDVIRIGFVQTTIMEMGQPPAEQSEKPGMWVEARQYSGRIVSVSNAMIFDEPVYNYSRDFPFIWEEMHIPISFKDDRRRAEAILLEAAERCALGEDDVPADAMRELQRRYFMKAASVKPKVYWRITDNWVELSVRFVTRTEGIRDVKDQMSRQILDQFDASGIGIASGTYAIVEVPPIRVVDGNAARSNDHTHEVLTPSGADR
jgi:small-conductance mechanosensitive channel